MFSSQTKEGQYVWDGQAKDVLEYLIVNFLGVQIANHTVLGDKYSTYCTWRQVQMGCECQPRQQGSKIPMWPGSTCMNQCKLPVTY